MANSLYSYRISSTISEFKKNGGREAWPLVKILVQPGLSTGDSIIA
jgi:hypothetical protein